MKDLVFRDPVHGLISFRGDDRPLANILETRAFQRLRRIRQMGFAWQVYPGAEHSRFGHALGSYHVATLITGKLDVSGDVARHVKAAALVHDIGHGPFSHTWELAFGGPINAITHEEWGARILEGDPELSAALEAIEPGLAATLSGFWQKTYHPAFARKLVSSQLDVDRLDYLLRDGHYSGAGYATYDLDWILHAVQVASVPGCEDPGDLVVDYRRGMFAVEQYLFARSYMYSQVYHHKTVRATEWMFLKLMERFAALCRNGQAPDGLSEARRLATEHDLSVDEYLRLDDMRVTIAIDGWARDATDPVMRDLASRLNSRRLFKTFDLGDDPGVIDRIGDDVHSVATRLFGDDARSYYELDNARRIGYEADAGEELFVVGHPRRGTVGLGALLDDVPLGRPISTVRLVCAPELVSPLVPVVAAALASS